VAAGLLPAEGIVAGDCYDVSLVDVATMGILVIDIAGHGATAAIAAMKSKEYIKMALRTGRTPGEALDFLYSADHGLESSFLTAVVCLLDLETGVCRYANAGHPAPVVVHDGEAVATLPPTGPLLGPIPGRWTTGLVLVPDEAKLLLYTDGLIEARDSQRQFFGEESLTDLVAKMPCESVHGVVKSVLDHIAEFNEGRLADDVTLVVACRSGDSRSD
jgi:phosphoserine phosphatase RsbU/P